MVASLLLNGPLAQVPEQSHTCSVLEEELWVVIQEQPEGPGPLPGLIVDIALDVIEGELMGLHEVSALIQVKLINALPQVEEGEAEEVVHGFYRGRIVSLAQAFVNTVPGLGHSCKVRYVCHGVVCEPGHWGDFIKVESVRGVRFSLSFAWCPLSSWRIVPMASVLTPLARDASALQIVLVVLVRVGLVPSHLLGSA